MQTKNVEPISEILESPRYLPCISLIMPFEPKMGLKKELDHKLKTAVNKIEKELYNVYPPDKSSPLLKKLDHVLSELNYYTHKKSIAIFISPIIEKVYYLDMPVEEKIIIDDSFEIRDLIYSKKQIHKYLLAVLSSKWTKIYVGNSSSFVKVTSNVPDNIVAFKKDISEKVANFSDEKKLKELLLNKFLLHTDNGLTLLLRAYKLPLFVMGTAKTIGHFKSITHNAKHVIDYIHGNFEEKTEPELHEVMQPYVADWKKVMQVNLLKQLDDSMSSKRLVYGIQNVWKSATQKKGKLLVVEKNYIYPAEQSSTPEVIFKKDFSIKNAFYIKDAVDDIIEKVLSSGGDIEFVDEGVLGEFQKIALIEYF